MLRLACAQSDVQESHSRVAVLDLGKWAEDGHDYALVTGHGVPPDRPCFVRDFDGRLSDVDRIVFAPDYKTGAQSDWALIRFASIATPGLIRYPLTPAPEAVLHGLDVTFARARSLRQNLQRCQLQELNFGTASQPFTRISHTCRSISGQSGSPVTHFRDGREYLVGLHIGQIWMHTSPISGRPDRKGYINLFDEAVISEIVDIAEGWKTEG